MRWVREEQKANYQLWTISRPERGNGLGTELAAELCSALYNLEAQPVKPRALVITATPIVKGPRRTWIGGGDLKELAAIERGDEAATYGRSIGRFMERLDHLPLPVIMAIDGAAIGGGAELALAGDLRLATQASHLEMRQLRIGLATGYGGARRLVELVGLSRAQGLVYIGAPLSAAEALALGLFHQVAADEGELWRAVERLTTDLATLEPAALAAQKRMLWHATHSHPGAARVAEAALFKDLWRNPAHARFLDDFVNKGKKP